MWWDHPFSQRSKTTGRAVGVGGWRQQVRGVGKNLEKGGYAI